MPEAGGVERATSMLFLRVPVCSLWPSGDRLVTLSGVRGRARKPREGRREMTPIAVVYAFSTPQSLEAPAA